MYVAAVAVEVGVNRVAGAVFSKTALTQSVLALLCNNPVEVVCFPLKPMINEALRSDSCMLDHRGSATR